MWYLWVALTFLVRNIDSELREIPGPKYLWRYILYLLIFCRPALNLCFNNQSSGSCGGQSAILDQISLIYKATAVFWQSIQHCRNNRQGVELATTRTELNTAQGWTQVQSWTQQAHSSTQHKQSWTQHKQSWTQQEQSWTQEEQSWTQHEQSWTQKV